MAKYLVLLGDELHQVRAFWCHLCVSSVSWQLPEQHHPCHKDAPAPLQQAVAVLETEARTRPESSPRVLPGPALSRPQDQTAKSTRQEARWAGWL